jgi:methionyl-tRNA synthetase
LDTYKKYNINFTNFHSTHSDENKDLSEFIYNKAKSKELISKSIIKQLFDKKEDMFLSDRFIKGACPKCGSEEEYGDNCSKCGATYDVLEIKDPISTISNSVPITKESEHIFFDLAKQEKILNDFLNDANFQLPVKNKLKEWLSDDLKKWDISRDKPYFGFEIPGEKDKYFYVWVDAPIGYLASIKNWANKNKIDSDELLSNESDYEMYHFIGKDISYFHGLFWPALLDAGDFKLPNGIFVHGFLTINGEKMSKSKGTGIMANEFADICDPETLRYYFAAKLNDKVEDIDLNFDDYVQRINSDLVGKYLNIASRSSTFVAKNNNKLSKNIDTEMISKLVSQKNLLIELYEKRNYSKLIRLIMDMADDVNKYINDKTPWKKELEEANDIATTALNAFYILTIYLRPILPELTEKVTNFLNQDINSFDDINETLKNDINTYKPLLNRLERIIISEEKPMNESNNINIDQFSLVDLRVAKIINASEVDGADKLLKLDLDVGDLGKKSVFAGIKSAYTPESLKDKLVILVNNLEPRKMKFGLSEGMVLASSNDDGIYLISPDDGALPGMKVK